MKDSGKIYARSLQQRGGVSNLTVQDNGEFHIFHTFNFAAPNLGVATLTGDPFGPQRANNVAENNGSQFNLFVTGNGKVSIDSAVDDGSGFTLQGLALSGGNNRGAVIGSGGASKIDLRDHASFVLQQNLYMTVSNGSVDATSNFAVVGRTSRPNQGRPVHVLRPGQSVPEPGQSTLTAVITGGTHSRSSSDGEAKIEFGNLAVELSGYAPHGGETYTLLTANSIGGTSFAATDFTLAAARLRPIVGRYRRRHVGGAQGAWVRRPARRLRQRPRRRRRRLLEVAAQLRGTPGYDAASLATWKAKLARPPQCRPPLRFRSRALPCLAGSGRRRHCRVSPPAGSLLQRLARFARQASLPGWSVATLFLLRAERVLNKAPLPAAAAFRAPPASPPRPRRDRQSHAARPAPPRHGSPSTRSRRLPPTRRLAAANKRPHAPATLHQLGPHSRVAEDEHFRRRQFEAFFLAAAA